jgi:hypothetical protein
VETLGGVMTIYIEEVIKADLQTLARQLIKSTNAMSSGCPVTIQKVADENRKLIKQLNVG